MQVALDPVEALERKLEFPIYGAGTRKKTAAKAVYVPVIVYTIGHSTRSIEQFMAMLEAYEIKLLVDIRTVPRSRTNPQFNQEVLPESLQAKGIAYVHMQSLGGLRKPRKDSPNTGWRNENFRGYADYMQTEKFAEAIEELIRMAAQSRTATMCAEAVHWRCHRSLVADALLVRGIAVEHILQNDLRSHTLTPFARADGYQITYPETISA